MSLEEKIIKLCSPGKVLKTKTRLRFFSSVDVGSRSQNRDPGIYIIKRSEIVTNQNRVCITLNDGWVLKFIPVDFSGMFCRESEINEHIEILGN